MEISKFYKTQSQCLLKWNYFWAEDRRASSDGSMSASGSAGPGFNPRQGSKF